MDLLAVIGFVPLFSARVWPHAQELLLGAILAPGKRTVSSVLRVLGRGQALRLPELPSRAQPGRLVGPGGGSAAPDWLLVESFVPAGAPGLWHRRDPGAALGGRIKARGIYRDAARSSKAVTNKASGLRWLSVQLLAPGALGPAGLGLAVFNRAGPFPALLPAEGPRGTKSSRTAPARPSARIRRWLPKRELIFRGHHLRRVGTAGLRPEAGGHPHYPAAPGCGPLCARPHKAGKGQGAAPAKRASPCPSLAQRLRSKRRAGSAPG